MSWSRFLVPPPIDWGELVQVHDECDVTQTSPDDLPVIDIHATVQTAREKSGFKAGLR